MLAFKQPHTKLNLVTKLGDQGQGGGDISSPRQTQGFGICVNRLNKGTG
jgi:hypothetical protein